MQYVVAVAWIAYIIHGLRRAYVDHCITQATTRFLQRLARIGAGMAPDEVQALLGPPDRVSASPEGVTWQYRVDGAFYPVAFLRTGAEEPPPALPNDPTDDEPPYWVGDEDVQTAVLESLRRAS